MLPALNKLTAPPKLRKGQEKAVVYVYTHLVEYLKRCQNSKIDAGVFLFAIAAKSIQLFARFICNSPRIKNEFRKSLKVLGLSKFTARTVANNIGCLAYENVIMALAHMPDAEQLCLADIFAKLKIEADPSAEVQEVYRICKQNLVFFRLLPQV